MPVNEPTSFRPRGRAGGLRGRASCALKTRCEAPVVGGVTSRARGGVSTAPVETAGGGGLGLSGGICAALPMPLGSASERGLAGPNGTPEIAELPAPAEPAGGVSWANAVAGAARPSATNRTSAGRRDIGALQQELIQRSCRARVPAPRRAFSKRPDMLRSRRRPENQT